MAAPLQPTPCGRSFHMRRRATFSFKNFSNTDLENRDLPPVWFFENARQRRGWPSGSDYQTAIAELKR